MLGPISDEDLKLFGELIYKHTGILMGLNKRALLSNRLKSRIQDLKLNNYREYYQYLKGPSHKDELPNFIDSVTTNETYFFRAPKIWEYFNKTLLPELAEAGKNSEIKIWSAASSSGEEPYTIAMCLEEYSLLHPKFKWTLTASDISPQMLSKCADATYGGRSIAKIPPNLLKRYFNKKGEEYQVKESLRNKVSFFRHRLQDKPPINHLDVIFLRNVMIYFDPPTKEEILNKMYSILNSNGILIVGESEGLVNFNAPFTYVMPAVFRKKEAVSHG